MKVKSSYLTFSQRESFGLHSMNFTYITLNFICPVLSAPQCYSTVVPHDPLFTIWGNLVLPNYVVHSIFQNIDEPSEGPRYQYEFFWGTPSDVPPTRNYQFLLGFLSCDQLLIHLRPLVLIIWLLSFLKSCSWGNLAECFRKVSGYCRSLISLVFLTSSGSFSRSVKLDFPLWSCVCVFPKCYICSYITNWFLYSNVFLFALESHWAYESIVPLFFPGIVMPPLAPGWFWSRGYVARLRGHFIC